MVKSQDCCDLTKHPQEEKLGTVIIFAIRLYIEMVTLILTVHTETVGIVQVLCYQIEKCSLHIFYDSEIVWLVGVTVRW